MAKKRQGLTDDVSLDVKLLTGAKVSIKAKNLRTGAIKLVTLSIEELFETQSSHTSEVDTQVDQSDEVSYDTKEMSIPESDSKFAGSEEESQPEEEAE